LVSFKTDTETVIAEANGLIGVHIAGAYRWKAGVLPNLLDNKEVFLHACATVDFALRAVADAVRTRTEKLPYYRVHSASKHDSAIEYDSKDLVAAAQYNV
jgi:hypothetical protein